MASSYCMLLGEEFLDKIKKCKKSWGYIDGTDDNDVLGVYAVSLDKEKTETCAASLNMFKHRNFINNYKKEIAYWAKAKKGLIEEIKDWNNKTPFEVMIKYLPIVLYEKIRLLKNVVYLLLIEEETNDILFACSYVKIKPKIVFPAEIQYLEAEPNPFKRLDGLVPLKEMKEKSIVIVGLGSGGSAIALELAAAGIGTLYLFDKDRLNSVNLFRHICGISDIGRKKVDAVADVIKDHLLPTTIKKYEDNIIYYPQQLRETVKFADIVICATDDPKSREMVNYICVKSGKPLILVCTFDNAKIGEIIRVIPHQTACYECTRIHLNEQGALTEDNESRDQIISYSPQTESPNGNSRGTRTDVFIVAAMAAKVTLMTLKDDAEDGFGELPYNYITWGAVRNTTFDEPYNFKQPFGTNYCNFNIHPECPICGALVEDIKDIGVEAKYDEIMEKLST